MRVKGTYSALSRPFKPYTFILQRVQVPCSEDDEEIV